MIALQFLVIGLFFHGTIHQAMITSYMMTPEMPKKLENIDELRVSNHKIYIHEKIQRVISRTPMYEEVYEQGRVISSNVPFWAINYTELAKNDIAIMMPKLFVNYLRNAGKLSEFYEIQSNALSHFTTLEFVGSKKVQNQWQKMIDLSFEAGLMQKLKSAEIQEPDQEISDGIMKFNQFIVSYQPFIAGSLIAGLVLLFEIFWKSCGEPLIKRWKLKRNKEQVIGGFWRRRLIKQRSKNIKRIKEGKGGKMKVRKIQVKPFDDGGSTKV